MHDGVRQHTYPGTAVPAVEQDTARNGAVAVLQEGRRVELSGVTGAQVQPM